MADAFHVYAVEWTQGRIDAFVDDTDFSQRLLVDDVRMYSLGG